MSLTELPQTIVSGLLLGCLYAGFALGLSLILGVLRIVNVAHSAVLIAGALVYWQLVNGVGIDPLLAILPVLAIFYLLGLGLHRGIAQRLAREQDSTVLLATFGLLVVIESIAILVWTTDTRNVNLGYLDTVLRFWGLNIRLAHVVAAVLILTILFVLHSSSPGRSPEPRYGGSRRTRTWPAWSGSMSRDWRGRSSRWASPWPRSAARCWGWHSRSVHRSTSGGLRGHSSWSSSVAWARCGTPCSPAWPWA